MTQLRGSTWGLNIGGLMAHYRPLGWLIRGSNGPHGWIAQKLDDTGRPVRGMRPVTGSTLDDLAAKMDAADDHGSTVSAT